MNTHSAARACIAALALLVAPLDVVAEDFEPEPPMLSRADWEARDADESLMHRHSPRFITVHNTGRKRDAATPLPDKMRRMQRFAQRRYTFKSGKVKPPWGDIAYHFIIGAEGRIAEARSVAFAGDTNTPYNTTDHILIALEGAFSHETPDPRQIEALTALTLWLAKTWSIPSENIRGHKDYTSATGCPGTSLHALLPELRETAAKP